MKRPVVPCLRWWIAAVLFGASVLNYVDRVALAVLAPQIRDGFGLTNREYAWVVNSFLISYTLFYPLGGWLADRFGPGRIFPLSVSLWSAASALQSTATGLTSFCCSRALLGMGAAPFYPLGIKTISQWFSARDRAQAISLLMVGLSVGATVSPLLVGFLSFQAGWRFAFLTTGLLGFALLPLWHFLHHDPPREHPSLTVVERNYLTSWPSEGSVDPDRHPITFQREVAENLKFCVRNKDLWWLLIARALGDSVWYFYIFWLPEYLVRNRAFDLGMLVRYAWLPFLSADMGGLAAGWMTGHLLRRGWSLDASRKTVMVAAAFLLPAGTLAYHSSTPLAAVSLICLATFGIMAYGTILLTIPTDIFTSRRLGLVTGLTGSAGSLAGAGFQLLVGWLVDRLSYGPVFLLAGSLHPLAAFIVLIGIRNIGPTRKE